MKQPAHYTLLLWLLLTVPTYANITIDEETVHVETDNYTVQFDKGVITHIHNKLTDQTYTLPPGQGRSGWTGLMFNRHFWKRENISTQKAELISASQTNPHTAELLFRQGGTDVRLSIAVDQTTADLLINIEGISDTPGIVGMQWGLGSLDIQNLSIIAPIEGGRVINATTPGTYQYHPYPGSGPGWEAQLAIVQGERGGCYVRNMDNTLQFKRFIYDRLDNGVALNFGTYNQAPFNSHATGNSKMWRFNTYFGDWRVPARIYRDWMEQAFDPTRLSDMPSWVEDITLFVKTPGAHMKLIHFESMIDRLAELVDPSKTLLYFGRWHDGGDWWNPEHDESYPDFFPKPGLQPLLEIAHQHGFRVMLYLVAHGMSPNHPLYPYFKQYQYRDTWTGELLGTCWDAPLDPPCDHPAAHTLAHISPASSEWRNLLVQRLKPIWQEYGIDGFFLDASHSVINDANGLIDRLNMAQGMALLHKELAAAMPGIVLGGERLHEASFVHESFAQRPFLSRTIELHPISTFLFSPFVHAIALRGAHPYRLEPLHDLLRYGEIWNVMPTITIWGADHLSEAEVHKTLDLAWSWEPEYGLNRDVNRDGIINIQDIVLVGQSFGVTPAHPQADVNGDGVVNVLDLILVSNGLEIEDSYGR